MPTTFYISSFLRQVTVDELIIWRRSGDCVIIFTRFLGSPINSRSFSLDLILFFSQTLKSHSFLFAPVSPFTFNEKWLVFHISCLENDWITFRQIVDLSCMTHFFHFSSGIITGTTFADFFNIVPRFFSEDAFTAKENVNKVTCLERWRDVSKNLTRVLLEPVAGWETCLSKCRKFLSTDKHLHEHQCQFQEVHDEDYWNDRSSLACWKITKS